jgi:hypothetical protein
MEPTPDAKPWICLRCEHVGTPATGGFGAMAGALMAIVGAAIAGGEAPALGGVALAIAGVAVAAGHGVGHSCPKCGARDVIPASSPRAQRART